MTSNRRRPLRGLFISTLVIAAAPGLLQCGKMPGGSALPGGGSCPSSAEEIASASWGLDPALEGKVKASLNATATLKDLSARVEGDLVAACGNLAKDLGATDADLQPKEAGPGKKAEAACNAAVKLLQDVKAKAKAQLTVEAKPPRCSASLDASADCAAKCDASVQPGSVKAECEGGHLSGKCDAQCSGTCSLEAGAQCTGACNGECSGACEAGFSGKCGGKCEGKCDGKDSKGQCAGTCEGKCDASASGSCGGTCKGTCSASCDVEAKGECKGTCTGECTVAMQAPKCTGEVKPPKMSAECQGHCDAKLSAEAECTPATVVVKTTGEADAQAALKLRTALTKNLPALLKVTMGMKASLEKASASVQTSLEGLNAVVTGSADAALKVGGCIATAIKAQADASMSINVSVKASASASAEGGVG